MRSPSGHFTNGRLRITGYGRYDSSEKTLVRGLWFGHYLCLGRRHGSGECYSAEHSTCDQRLHFSFEHHQDRSGTNGEFHCDHSQRLRQ